LLDIIGEEQAAYYGQFNAHVIAYRKEQAK